MGEAEHAAVGERYRKGMDRVFSKHDEGLREIVPAVLLGGPLSGICKPCSDAGRAAAGCVIRFRSLRAGVFAPSTQPGMIEIRINGEIRQFESSPLVSDVLDALKLTGKRIAVEHNGRIVPKSQHHCTRCETGDVIEIVVAVGGG